MNGSYRRLSFHSLGSCQWYYSLRTLGPFLQRVSRKCTQKRCLSKSFLSSSQSKVKFFLRDLSPGAPPAPVRLSGQKIFEEKFSPFQWTGRWNFVTNGGSSQHFYRRLNASKSARIESREDSKTQSVAKIGKNGVFFVKRARCNPRLSHSGCLSFIKG